jgi:hypothetical protein
MKVLIQSDCAARGEFLAAGECYELDSDIAAELIKLGRALEAPVEQVKPKPARKTTAA